MQALWGTRISYAWDRVHLIATFALLAFALPHVVVTLLRDRAAALKLGLEALRAASSRTLARAGRGLRAHARAGGRAVGGSTPANG